MTPKPQPNSDPLGVVKLDPKGVRMDQLSEDMPIIHFGEYDNRFFIGVGDSKRIKAYHSFLSLADLERWIAYIETSVDKLKDQFAKNTRKSGN